MESKQKMHGYTCVYIVYISYLYVMSQVIAAKVAAATTTPKDQFVCPFHNPGFPL